MLATLTMNPTIDKSAEIGTVSPNRKLRCKRPRHDPGGGGINVSRAVHRLGGDSLALFPAAGPTGQMLSEKLREEGVRHDTIEVRGLTRINLTVKEAESGDQYRFNFPGSEMEEAEWRRLLEMVRELGPQARWIVASGSLAPGVPDDFYARVASIARDQDSKVILDASGEALRLAMKSGVYLIKPNVGELNQLAGEDLESETAQIDFASELIEAGSVRVVVVSLGAGGALLVTAEGHTHVRSPTVPIKSRIGAGDSMVAGMALGLDRGEKIERAVRFGVAAGAAAVMTSGTDLCQREEVEELFRQIEAR